MGVLPHLLDREVPSRARVDLVLGRLEPRVRQAGLGQQCLLGAETRSICTLKNIVKDGDGISETTLLSLPIPASAARAELMRRTTGLASALYARPGVEETHGLKYTRMEAYTYTRIEVYTHSSIHVYTH